MLINRVNIIENIDMIIVNRQQHDDIEKEKKVILLYYYEELTLKEISEVLEVSESRVSQLHTRALQKMREKLGDYLGIVTNSR